MIMKSFGLLFYLKKRSGYVSGDLPIYMRITVDGVSKEISLLRMCDPTRWNSETARMVGAKETVRALNAYLDTLQAKVYEAKHLLIQNGKPVTAEFIKNLVQGREVQSEPARMLIVIFHHHNDQMAALVGREYAPGTLVRFKTALKHTRDFLLWKYKAPDIDIKKLDYEFVSEFEFWFKSEKKCDHNTTIKYIACCKKIVLRCIRNGWLQRNPFMGFNMALREVDREALTEEELQTMAGKQFPSDRLTNVRDIFLFSCFTGLAYADVKKLKRTEISTGIDGDKWIFTKRKKTDTPSRIPILPMALEILKRYEDHPACLIKGIVLPILTNQKMNAYLKEIADVCGIHKNLTFHIARHTFATTVTLSNGVPIETVSKILGHRSLRTTQHYAKILDRKVSQDMQALKERLSFKTILGGEKEKKLG
jgi:site-specific recombinase XerD